MIGNTAAIPKEPFEELAGVQQVVRVSERYRLIGRHKGQVESLGFEYNGVRFDAGDASTCSPACARSTRARTSNGRCRALKRARHRHARAWAPTSRAPAPTTSRATARECLPYVFELAGKYGIRVIAMEVTHEPHIDEIRAALERSRATPPA